VVSVRDAGKLDWVAVPQLEPTHVLLLGATARSLQMAGALEAMLGMTLEYAQQRVAFGKTIAKFQAVQQRMAQLGGEVAAAIAVSQSAAEALASATDYAAAAVWLEVASAKIRCGEAAEAACAIAHQVHGAIGFAAEHPLHRFTLRALGWRDDFGDEVFWAKRLGKLVTSDRQAPLWHFLASR
jgi:acyl-CoA dehydrogenase